MSKGGSPMRSNQWYNCWYVDRPELCKITQAIITDTNTGAEVHAWRVVCYYTGKDIYTGTLKECRLWIEEHLIGGKYLE